MKQEKIRSKWFIEPMKNSPYYYVIGPAVTNESCGVIKASHCTETDARIIAETLELAAKCSKDFTVLVFPN